MLKHIFYIVILFFLISSCTWQLENTNQLILPESALNIVVLAVNNSTFQPTINNTIELELKNILQFQDKLILTEYLADLALQVNVIQVYKYTTYYTGLQRDFYTQNYRIDVRYQILDLRAARKIVKSAEISNIYSYNSLYETPEERELVQAFNISAKTIATKIIESFNLLF